MIQTPVLGVPAAPGAADTCRGLPARRPRSHQLHAHVGEHHVSTAPRSPEQVPRPTEEGDWMGGEGVCGWQEEEKQVRTGTGAGRVKEVGKMGGWRK